MFNPQHACIARVTIIGLCVSVCLSAVILELQGVLSDTNGLLTTQVIMWIFLERLHSSDMP